jgi:hypothetical protein
LWNHAAVVFSYLSHDEQLALHDYYQPSENLTVEELHAHRVTSASERPDLVGQASRALEKLDTHAVQWALKRTRLTRVKVLARARMPAGGRGKIRVSPVYRPKPDYPKLVAALRAYVIRQQELDAVIEDDSASASPRRAA